jgi:hypothetical protein
MNYWGAILSGIAGTLLMTGYLYLLTYITGWNFKVVRTLSIMLTKNSSRKNQTALPPLVLLRGIIVHYAIGAMFALVYLWLWAHGIGKPDLVNGVVFGTLNGLFAIGFWYMFMTLHKRPVAVPMPAYLIAVGSGHILFGIGTVFTYNLQIYLSKVID